MRAQLLEKAAEAAKSATAHLSEAAVEQLVLEAVQWAKKSSCE